MGNVHTNNENMNLIDGRGAYNSIYMKKTSLGEKGCKVTCVSV